MTAFQKTVKNMALAFAIILTIFIIGSIASGATMVFTFFGFFEFSQEEMEEYSETLETIHSLDIHLETSKLTIEKGDTFKLTAYTYKGFSPEVKDGTLKIHEKDFKLFGLLFKNNANSYTLTVPEGTTFEEVEITLGAGKAQISDFSAQNLNIKAGVAQFTAENLSASQANIKGGVGELDFIDCSMSDISLKSGVGQLTYTGTMEGECKIDSGVGSADIHLYGNKQDFEIRINAGLGGVAIDGEKQENKSTINKGAPNTIHIKSGIGAANLNFSD